MTLVVHRNKNNCLYLHVARTPGRGQRASQFISRNLFWASAESRLYRSQWKGR